MQIMYYRNGGSDGGEMFLHILMHQGTAEIRRVLNKRPIFRDKRVRLIWRTECQMSTIVMPTALADYSGFGTTLYDLAWSEAHGFRSDPEE